MQEKNYLHINVFLASSGRVERNLKGLLIKATKSFNSKAKREILSSINENLSRNHSDHNRKKFEVLSKWSYNILS